MHSATVPYEFYRTENVKPCYWKFPKWHVVFFLLPLNREGHGKISVFAVKMALATLCGGKIMDKLRCKLLSVCLFACPSCTDTSHPRSCQVPCSFEVSSCYESYLKYGRNCSSLIFRFCHRNISKLGKCSWIQCFPSTYRLLLFITC